jgi:hypothetical protein
MHSVLRDKSVSRQRVASRCSGWSAGVQTFINYRIGLLRSSIEARFYREPRSFRPCVVSGRFDANRLLNYNGETTER